MPKYNSANVVDTQNPVLSESGTSSYITELIAFTRVCVIHHPFTGSWSIPNTCSGFPFLRLALGDLFLLIVNLPLFLLGGLSRVRQSERRFFSLHLPLLLGSLGLLSSELMVNLDPGEVVGRVVVTGKKEKGWGLRVWYISSVAGHSINWSPKRFLLFIRMSSKDPWNLYVASLYVPLFFFTIMNHLHVSFFFSSLLDLDFFPPFLLSRLHRLLGCGWRSL